MNEPDERNYFAGNPATLVVLCVDDDPEVLTAIQRTLRNEPYKVVTAGHAAGALDWLEALPVRLVIADEHMPRISGTELLQEVHKRYPETRKVILTAYPGHRVMNRSKAVGVDALLFKPWDDEGLRRTVRRILADQETGPEEGMPEAHPS